MSPVATSRAGAPHGSSGPAGSAVVLLERADERFRREWSAAVIRSGNPFLSPWWVDAYAAHLATGPTWLVASIRDGRPVAVLPLTESVLIGQRVLRLPGARIGGHFGPAVDPEAACDTVPALAAGVRELADRRGAVVLLEHIDEDAAWWGAFTAASDRLRFARLSTTATPVVDTPEGGWEGYLAERSGELRRQLGKKMRRAVRDHRAEVRRTGPGDDGRAAMDRFLDLHRAAWRSRGGSALDDPRLAAFVRSAGVAAQESGHLRGSLIEMDGRAGATVIGFAVATPVYLFQTGMDPVWDRYSLGQLAYADALRCAMEAGAPWIDLGEGTQDYKLRFATRVKHRSDFLLTRPGDPRGIAVPLLTGLRHRAAGRGPLHDLGAALRRSLRPGADAGTRARRAGGPTGGPDG